MGLRVAVSRSFKGIFGFFAALGLLLIAVIGMVLKDMGALNILVGPGILIPVGLIVWILCKRRTKPSFSEDPRFSAFGDMDRKATETVYPGLGATVEIRADGISITRQGAVAVLAHGLKGEKRIAFTSITATQFREATPKMHGYIQFSILGGVESGRGMFDATKDENTVMFTHAQNQAFHRLRDVVEQKMTEARQPARAEPLSIADEIAKLAELNRQGILTDGEFSARKAALLN